jgi:hypothetical protein
MSIEPDRPLSVDEDASECPQERIPYGVWIPSRFEGLSSEFPDENRNGLRMPDLVIDHRRVYGPIHSGNRAGRQLIVKDGSFADQRKAVTLLDQHLHFGRMRGTRILFNSDARIRKQFKKPLMRVRMTKASKSFWFTRSKFFLAICFTMV